MKLPRLKNVVMLCSLGTPTSRATLGQTPLASAAREVQNVSTVLSLDPGKTLLVELRLQNTGGPSCVSLLLLGNLLRVRKLEKSIVVVHCPGPMCSTLLVSRLFREKFTIMTGCLGVTSLVIYVLTVLLVRCDR